MFKLLLLTFITSCTIAATSRTTAPVPQLVRGEGYPLEVHNVTTEDGYILTLHRIPHGKSSNTPNKRVVLLVHALLCTSSFWLLYPGTSLGYALADAGYDVWLVNTRGNSYSRRHLHLDPDEDEAFWDFSWHEVGFYDLPATIDYMLEATTASSVFYCGHSQGTTALYVLTSLKPEYNAKIKVQVSLGPTALLSHSKTPVVRLAALLGSTRSLSRLLQLDKGLGEFMPSSSWPSLVGKTFCRGFLTILCELAIFLLVGFNNFEISPESIPMIVGQAPQGASTKEETHYVQIASSGEFRQFDYGSSRNLEVYGGERPPSYNLSMVTVPGYSVHGVNDWITTVRDVEELHRRLGNPKERYLIKKPPFNHLDYLCAKNITGVVNAKIFEYFAQYG